jgi:hypothetical protein
MQQKHGQRKQSVAAAAKASIKQKAKKDAARKKKADEDAAAALDLNEKGEGARKQKEDEDAASALNLKEKDEAARKQKEDADAAAALHLNQKGEQSEHLIKGKMEVPVDYRIAPLHFVTFTPKHMEIAEKEVGNFKTKSQFGSERTAGYWVLWVL